MLQPWQPNVADNNQLLLGWKTLRGLNDKLQTIYLVLFKFNISCFKSVRLIQFTNVLAMYFNGHSSTMFTYKFRVFHM